MACFGGLGIGLSIAFGCLLLAFGAEIYYLLWRKKRITVVTLPPSPESDSSDPTRYAKQLLTQLTSWIKKPSSEPEHPSRSTDRAPDSKQYIEDDPELGTVVKQFSGEESVESELMRLHNLSGPPRFLFTIKEETREDLESDDGRSRKGSRARSLSDLILALDTPFLTPLPSPPLKPSSLNSSPLLDSYNNPLFESSAASARPPPSPPPKFKFLRDAEEKLYRRLKEEAAAKLRETHQDNKSAALTAVSVMKSNNDSSAHKVTAPSSSSQVLPLAYSPAALKPAPDKKSVVR